jgi:hypothetical protein
MYLGDSFNFVQVHRLLTVVMIINFFYQLSYKHIYDGISIISGTGAAIYTAVVVARSSGR